jgi:hypothetical protein
MVAFPVRRKLFICSHIVPFDNSQWITLEPQMARQHGQLRKQQQKDLGPSAALATRIVPLWRGWLNTNSASSIAPRLPPAALTLDGTALDIRNQTARNSVLLLSIHEDERP